MKKIIYKWWDPKQLIQAINNRITLKNKIISKSVQFIIFTLSWVLIWFLSYLNPKTNTIPFLNMLPIAVGAGAVFVLLAHVISIIKSNIKFYNNKWYYFTSGIGLVVSYEDTLSYTISEIIDNNTKYNLLILKYKKNNDKQENIRFIEIPSKINENEFRRFLGEKNILVDPNLTNSKYIQNKIFKYFRDN